MVSCEDFAHFRLFSFLSSQMSVDFKTLQEDLQDVRARIKSAETALSEVVGEIKSLEEKKAKGEKIDEGLFVPFLLSRPLTWRLFQFV
jgi:hypothetical protein